MDLQICEESVTTLSEQARISIAFEYDTILELTIAEAGLGGFLLSKRRLGHAQRKDYDEIDGDSPTIWAERFDVSNWGYIVARSQGNRIGGAVIAFDSLNVEILEKRRDLAVLWDIRVDPAFRGHGVGAALFHAVENWASERKCVRLKIETQNINLAACKFYARQGCTLGAINRYAYPERMHEIQMLWYKDLRAQE